MRTRGCGPGDVVCHAVDDESIASSLWDIFSLCRSFSVYTVSYTYIAITTWLGEPSLPHITPDGYNASLHQSEVELRCLLHQDVLTFLWLIDGVSSVDIRPENRTQQGLRYNHEILTDDDLRYVPVFIDPRSENNNTVFQCIAFFANPPQIHNSNEVVFRVQGELVSRSNTPQSAIPLCTHQVCLTLQLT